MHKTVIYNTGETIRFRRWSGKGYAIFRSLHRHVTIGRVCKSIADSALSKDKNTMNLGNGSRGRRRGAGRRCAGGPGGTANEHPRGDRGGTKKRNAFMQMLFHRIDPSFSKSLF